MIIFPCPASHPTVRPSLMMTSGPTWKSSKVLADPKLPRGLRARHEIYASAQRAIFERPNLVSFGGAGFRLPNAMPSDGCHTTHI